VERKAEPLVTKIFHRGLLKRKEENDEPILWKPLSSTSQHKPVQDSALENWPKPSIFPEGRKTKPALRQPSEPFPSEGLGFVRRSRGLAFRWLIDQRVGLLCWGAALFIYLRARYYCRMLSPRELSVKEFWALRTVRRRALRRKKKTE
jgi:hypothetical protein